jgi:hypothetical protein
MADRPQTVNAAWARGGTRMPAAAPPVRPRGPQGRHRADARPSLHLLPFSLPLCASGRKQSRCHCHELRRRRAHSPLHHCPPNLVPSSVTTPSTSPFFLGAPWAAGEATFSDPPRSPRAGPHQSPTPLWSGYLGSHSSLLFLLG